MKRLTITISLALLIFTSLASCSDKELPLATGISDTALNNITTMKLIIGTRTFVASFSNNATAAAFKALLPLTLNMGELNGNEKYYDLPSSLPANASNPGSITNGDIMLYGSKTLVVFYKSFSSSYSYTRIGQITNVSGLVEALGTGAVTIRFEQ